jgi:hypothetical protein
MEVYTKLGTVSGWSQYWKLIHSQLEVFLVDRFPV